MEAIDIERGDEGVVISPIVLRRLLELLQVAARRGAFELDEYLSIGEVFLQARAVVPNEV